MHALWTTKYRARAGLLGRLIGCAVALLVAGCEGPSPPTPGRGPRRLEIVDPPGSQIGLHYNASTDLPVRLVTDDADATPVSGVDVRFSIFGDPKGSTLSADRARTTGDGLATVRLSSGAAEASFRIVVTADNALDVAFDVAVSKLDFVSLSIALDWQGSPAFPSRLEAALYEDASCAELAASQSPPAPARRLYASDTPIATLTFSNLLSRGYSVSARVLGPGLHAVGGGCIDLLAEQLPPGTRVTVPLPLAPLQAALATVYRVTTLLQPSLQTLVDARSPWHRVSDCRRALATDLLDFITGQGSPGLAAAIAAKRGTPDASGCRPASSGGGDSLDQLLTALLEAPPTSLAAQLPDVVADVDAIFASARLTSRMSPWDGGASGLRLDHRLESLTLTAAASGERTYDLAAWGQPVIEAAGVAVFRRGGLLSIAPHQFTLGMPSLWSAAIGDLALAPRLGVGAAPTPVGYLAALLAQVSSGALTGCAAVEAELCASLGVGPCAIDATCQAWAGDLAGRLSAPVAPVSGADLTLTGTATVLDADGDLLAEGLDGEWTTSLAGADTQPFSGARQ